jgi:hypothetical protein
LSLKIKNKNGEWVVDQKAIQTSLIDLEGNFKSSNVEGALRELAEKLNEAPDFSEIDTKIELNKQSIINVNTKIAEIEEDVEWLKENGGGGGGSLVPTIESTFEDCAVDKGTDVTIPIFFTSPAGGTGTAYISVNNMEVDSAGVKQGNNNIKVLAKHLTATNNKITIYVRDRSGIASNQLSWNVISGGITLETSFDYESDYGITDIIKMPYTIETGIEGDIVLHLTVDGITYEIPSYNGFNEYTLSDLSLGLGTHTVSMYATVDKYISKTISFNVVIISTTELYLSSSFVSGSQFAYGVPIPVNYRLSKKSTESYTVHLMIDGRVTKIQTLPIGSYYWTITDLAVGIHELTIKATSLDELEEKTLSLSVEVVKGEYTPVEDYKYGLLCDLNSVGKSNNDSTGDIWVDDSGNGNNGKLIGFNFDTNGFINDTLICDNNAYVEIPWSPWAANATGGSTIDLIYTPINAGIEECRVLDYTSIIDSTSTAEVKPFKGIFADITQTISSSASSGQSAGHVNLDDESGEIHLTWVLDRENKFMKTYINGILSRIMYLTDSGSGSNKFYEDFSHDNFIYLNSEKGKNCGVNHIKRFRVYGHALTSDQILQNHLANIKDLEEQERLYNFNYNNATLPKMYLYGDTTNMTDKQTVDMRIEYVSPNEEKYGPSFGTGIQNNPVHIQGTSSLAYVRKNYTIYLKDEYGSDMYYNPYGAGSKPDYVFCLKADYIESSHANNTGLAKFVNDCVYETKLPTQLEDENCRSTINGFPIEVFMNGESLGIYNFNHDRYSIQSYGYDYKKYPNMLVYEINSNSNTSAGAFYRYGDNPESSVNISERDYYARDFKLIYGNRTSSNDSYAEVKELVEWVSVAEYDLFKETINEHFNKEYLFRYLLTVLMVGGVDSLGKNLKMNTFDGKVWYPTFYDMDTSLGIDNTGYLTIKPDVEIEEGSFNTSNSNLWSKVMEYFAKELKEEWALMRQKNFTLDKLMEYVYEQQIAQIPAKYYNDDAQVKYLDFGSLYTYCCHGSKEHLIRRWLRERIAYVDSMLEYFTSQHEQVILRMNKTGEVSFDVTSYIPLYFSVKWSNAAGGTQTIKLKRGEKATFSFNSTTATDQEVIVYHSHHIKRLDNLSNLNLSSCLLGNATRLTEVEIHSPLLYNINVTENRFLKKLDLSGCKTLGTVVATGSTIDLSNCRYLEYVNLYDTALTSVTLDTKGGSLREIYFPTTLSSLTMIKQPLLHTLGLPYGNFGEEVPTALYTVDIRDCTSIKKFNTSPNFDISSSLVSMSYCNNLTIRNSLDLTELRFDGFKQLKNVIIENMYNLESVEFNDLLEVGQTPTLGFIGMSNCPLLTNITLNCSNNLYEITFTDNAILDFGRLSSLEAISSNCVIKGVKTIVVPKGLKDLDFKLQYGTGDTSIENIWVSDVCSVNTEGITPTVTHINRDFTGIDFKGMSIRTIDMAGFSKIQNAINFNIAPTLLNPNLNTTRDGSEARPWFRPTGTLDLREYKSNWNGMFKGLDLGSINILMPNNPINTVTDISNMFEGAKFNNELVVNSILSMFPNASTLDYIFKKAEISNAKKINFPRLRFTLIGGFMQSHITSDIELPLNVANVTDCFKECHKMKYASSNWNRKFTYSVTSNGCYYDCINIVQIDGIDGGLSQIPYAWGGHGYSYENGGEYTVEILEDNYTLTMGTLLLDGTVDWGDGSYSHNNSTHRFNKAGVYTIKGKVLPNIIGEQPHNSVLSTLVSVANLPSIVDSFENMFANCQVLRYVTLNNADTSNVVNTRRMFYNNEAMITAPEFDFTSVKNMNEMYSGCSKVLTLKFKNLCSDSVECNNLVDGCERLDTINFIGRTNKVNAKKIIDLMGELISQEDVESLAETVNELNLEKNKQHEEILLNMDATVDIFELLIDLIYPQTVNEKPKTRKNGNKIIELYVALILKGKKTINQVPEIIRPQVEKILKGVVS